MLTEMTLAWERIQTFLEHWRALPSAEASTEQLAQIGIDPGQFQRAAPLREALNTFGQYLQQLETQPGLAQKIESLPDALQEEIAEAVAAIDNVLPSQYESTAKMVREKHAEIFKALSQTGSGVVCIKPRRLIITAHGIRTHGAWQVRLQRLLRVRKNEVFKFVHLNYGFFSFLQDIIPFLRYFKIRWCTERLRPLITQHRWDRIDIVAHSFGTHLIARSLQRLARDNAFEIHTVILAGSVLRLSFSWESLQREGAAARVNRVINECGLNDRVLLVNQLLVFLGGAAGRFGLRGGLSETLWNRFYPFGHSGYFKPLSPGGDQDAFMSENWLPLLLHDEDLTLTETTTPSALYDALNWIFRLLEPVKLTIILSPVLAFLLFLFVAHAKAVVQKGEEMRIKRVAALEAYRNGFASDSLANLAQAYRDTPKRAPVAETAALLLKHVPLWNIPYLAKACRDIPRDSRAAEAASVILQQMVQPPVVTESYAYLKEPVADSAGARLLSRANLAMLCSLTRIRVENWLSLIHQKRA